MSQTKKRILIVDDEKDVGLTVKVILEKYGFDIDYFTEPALAFQKFKPNFYDVIIQDIRMPEFNGFQLYFELKSRDSKIKTLFFTALTDVESYNNTQGSKLYPIKGERHFIRKPISNQDLLEQVYSMLN